MRKSSRLILGFASLGLTVSALILAWLKFAGEFDGELYSDFAIICPPALICIPLSEVMKDKFVFYTVWLLIGLANGGLYAIVGAAIVGLFWKPDEGVDSGR